MYVVLLASIQPSKKAIQLILRVRRFSLFQALLNLYFTVHRIFYIDISILNQPLLSPKVQVFIQKISCKIFIKTCNSKKNKLN